MNGSIPCPCGNCMPCKINRKRLWTHRIILESLTHENNSFVTLTYDDENLPENGSLKPDDYQKFIKRLRRKLPQRIRFYLVGEYGDRTWRPHYHFALFGASCPNADIFGHSVKGCECHLCTSIRTAWGKGNIDTGTLNKDSAQYISGYVTKKMTKPDDPRLQGRHPEFARMSNRPGIGADAMLVVADALNSKFGDSMLTEQGDVPISLKHGKRSLPLGRYLRNKLREFAQIEETVNPQTGEIKYAAHENAKTEYKKEMQALYFDFIKGKEYLPNKFDFFKNHLVKQEKQKVLNIETRSKIFKKEKTI